MIFFQNLENQENIKISILEFLDKNAYVDYYSIRRDKKEITLFENKYYNEEAPEYNSEQNVLAFSLKPKIIENSDSYELSAEFDLLMRIRQMNHEPRDTKKVKIPLFTKVYTNGFRKKYIDMMDFEDSCLFKFWQEGYVGSFIHSKKIYEEIDIIIPNSNFLLSCEISTICSVALAMIFTLWIIISSQSPEKIKTN